MSGSDRMIVRDGRAGCQKGTRKERVHRHVISKRNALDLATADANAARTMALTRAMAVKALGGLAVAQAERFRAKGWSVRSIAKHMDEPSEIIAALFGVVGEVG